jgi:excisionase family DNA binding protein
MASTKWITTKDVADRLNIHVETVRRWVRVGDLRAVSIGGKGGYRIKEKDLDDFLQSRVRTKKKLPSTDK